ncbi:MAG TPA: hydrogen peroxide-inducible genes activator [Verrucomicrobiae bacterium]|nr:hydrogen peroxide-inducible genes activator [Verrucomicrobiae bacterium]
MEDLRIPASSMPTLRQLQFLLAIRAEGSFVAAAEAVGVTQPTLSAGIKELEVAVGAILVERGRAGALLTPAGEEAADRAARAVSEVEELVRAVHTAGEPFSGSFRLGAIPTIAPFLLPRVMPLLKKRFPKLRLQMREDLTARLVDALRARTLDAAVIALPYSAHGIATSPVAEDEFLLVCPETHPLAARNDLAPEHLKSEDVLLLEDGHCLREHALSACRLGPQRRSSEVGATSLHTLVQMVSGGMGVTLLPKIAAEGGVAAGAHVAVRPFSEPLVGRSIGVAWREGGQREEEARLLADVLRNDLFAGA